MCDVGVVFALGIEAGGLEDLLKSKQSIRGQGFRVNKGRLRGRDIAVVVSGPGGPAAAQATQALLDGHRPAVVISAGFAGGLDPRLARHDILLADSLTGCHGEVIAAHFPTDLHSLAPAPGVHVGRLLSVEHVVRAPDEKRQLGQQHEAMAVDMESLSVVMACREHRVPVLAVRVLSDAVDDRLPPEVGVLLRQRTTAARLGAVMGSVLHRPGNLKSLWSLHQNAIAGSDRLAGFLADVIDRLPAARPELPGM